MIIIDNKYLIMNKNEYIEKRLDLDKFIFNINNLTKKNNNSSIFYINFDNNKKNTIRLLKKLKKIQQKNENIGIEYGEYKLIGIINNENDEIIECIKAIFIKDKNKKYEFIYDKICDNLDKIWKKENPCKFENNICISERNRSKRPRINGCCYAFWYTRLGTSITGIHICEHLDEGGLCKNKNISCKLFVCPYLRKKEKFKIRINDNLLMQVFFNRFQKLVVKNNFFVDREVFIKKLKKEEKRIGLLVFFYVNRDFLIYKKVPSQKRKIAKEYNRIYKKTNGLRQNEKTIDILKK